MVIASSSLHAKRAAFRLIGIALVACGCSKSSSAPTDSTGSHILSVSAGIYNVNLFTGSGVMLDVQLLVDGTSVADQQFPSGSDVADFTYSKTYSSAGSHRVSVRVVKQRDATDVYSMSGAAVGAFGSTSLSTTFPTDNYTLSAGGQISATVGVP